MKKILLLLLCVTLALCACRAPLENIGEASDGNTTDATDPPGDGESTLPRWKAAYLDLIEQREREFDFDFRYALIYIDHDDIPELYAVGDCEAMGDLVCSYKNGRIVEQGLNRRYGGRYVERGGILINQNGHMGNFYDTAYRLDENGFSQILNGYFTQRCVSLEDEELELITTYYIGDEPVTEEEYRAAIDAAVDLSKTVEFYDASVPYDEIKQQIHACK